MNKIKNWIRIFKICRLKAKARKLAKTSKVDHYVIMWLGKPEILSRDGFKYLRQRGVFPLSFTAANLKEIAIYQAKG